MKLNRLIIGCFLSFFVFSLGFAQDKPEKPQAEIAPSITVTGRIVSRGRGLALITAEGNGYIIEEAKTSEKVFTKLKELADKDADVTVNCLDTGEERGSKYFDHATKSGMQTNYRVLGVTSIGEVTQPSKVTNLNISKPIPYQPPLTIPAPPLVLAQIKGKISKCNFKSVIPTIELEGKKDFVLIITADTQIGKVVADQLAQFRPKEILKEGTEIEVWYEERGAQNIAHIITINE